MVPVLWLCIGGSANGEYQTECNTQDFDGSIEVCAIEEALTEELNDYRCEFGKTMSQDHLKADTRLAISYELAIAARQYARYAATHATRPHQGYPQARRRFLTQRFPELQDKIGGAFKIINEIEAPARNARGGNSVERTIILDFAASPGHKRAMMGSHSLLGSERTSSHMGAGAYVAPSGKVYAVILFADIKDHFDGPEACSAN